MTYIQKNNPLSKKVISPAKYHDDISKEKNPDGWAKSHRADGTARSGMETKLIDKVLSLGDDITLPQAIAAAEQRVNELKDDQRKKESPKAVGEQASGKGGGTGGGGRSGGGGKKSDGRQKRTRSERKTDRQAKRAERSSKREEAAEAQGEERERIKRPTKKTEKKGYFRATDRADVPISDLADWETSYVDPSIGQNVDLGVTKEPIETTGPKKSYSDTDITAPVLDEDTNLTETNGLRYFEELGQRLADRGVKTRQWYENNPSATGKQTKEQKKEIGKSDVPRKYRVEGKPYDDSKMIAEVTKEIRELESRKKDSGQVKKTFINKKLKKLYNKLYPEEETKL